MSFNTRFAGAALALAAIAAAPTAGAQTYPDRAVRLVVPFAPGQSADIVARVLAEKLGKAFGQTFIVENRPGAGGTVGSSYVAKAPADGYTLLMATIGPMSQAPALYPKLAYSPTTDFAPISNVALTPQVLVVNPASGFNTLQQLIDKAKAAPGTINFASSGIGSNQHVTMELFESRAGIKLSHIPYKGGAESYTAIFAGEVPVMFDAIPAVLPHVKSGKLKALAIASAERSPFLPDVPTLSELGVPKIEAVGWMGMAAPANTPPAVLDALNSKLRKVLDEPDVKAQLKTLAFVPAGDSRADFGAFLKSENEKWSAVIQDAGIKLN
jgi:tripartite-type tricarboxylate transporter receptor subunit TctC